MCFLRTKNLSSRQKKGLVLLLIGFSCFIAAFSLKEYQKFQQNSLSFSEAPKPENVVEEQDLPAKILIPRLRIDLSVFPAKVANNNWEVSDEAASYLLGSGIPGREGNVVIYAHNKNHLFGPIRWLEEGDKIRMINKKGEEFIYKVVETKTVSPDKVEVLSSTPDATLTLYTCIGFLDRERFVAVAELKPGQK